ncbi:MAG: hypothetical protein HUJ26_18975 [Planctomycetaceae bacterium]|nr:hypothetical protein [Planctomycetaceae bacterium]
MASMNLEVQLKAQILGDEKLLKQLVALGDRGSKNAMKAGIRRGMTILRQGVRSHIPTHAKSIRKAVGSKYNDRRGVAKVGINVGKKKAKGNYAPHGAMYVLGTGPRYHADGSYAGEMPENPVVQKALKSHGSKAYREMKVKIEQRIQKEAGKT